MIPIAVKFSRMASTALTIDDTELCGNIRDSSCTRYVDSSARPKTARIEIVRNVSGTKARRA